MRALQTKQIKLEVELLFRCILCLLRPRPGQVVNDVSLTEKGYVPDDGSGKLVGIQELAELESVCVATATGDVILYNLTTNEVSRKLI